MRGAVCARAGLSRARPGGRFQGFGRPNPKAFRVAARRARSRLRALRAVMGAARWHGARRSAAQAEPVHRAHVEPAALWHHAPGASLVEQTQPTLLLCTGGAAVLISSAAPLCLAQGIAHLPVRPCRTAMPSTCSAAAARPASRAPTASARCRCAAARSHLCACSRPGRTGSRWLAARWRARCTGPARRRGASEGQCYVFRTSALTELLSPVLAGDQIGMLNALRSIPTHEGCTRISPVSALV